MPSLSKLLVTLAVADGFQKPSTIRQTTKLNALTTPDMVSIYGRLSESTCVAEDGEQPVTSALRLQHIDVVLVGPQYASNVGQALRLCACFEVGRLKLVAPEYDRDADATYERRFAMPQGRAVRDARTIVCDTLDAALEDVEFSVAFSGRGRADQAFAAAAPALASNNRRTALVFGREADGLRAEELARCGTSVEIASADSLNLSHAVSIALADIYARAAESEPAAPDVAPDATVDALVARLGKALGADEGFRATSRGKVSACVEINAASMA